jgi:RHS repeat-associated protein
MAFSVGALGATHDIDGTHRQDVPASAVQEAPLEVEAGLRISSHNRSVGQRVAVAVEWFVPSGASVGAVDGILRFDPGALRLLGQGQDAVTLTKINDRRARRGEVRVLSVNPWGLDEVTVVLAFEVLSADYAADLRYEPLAAAPSDLARGKPIITTRSSLSVDDTLRLPRDPTVSTDAWMQRWEARTEAAHWGGNWDSRGRSQPGTFVLRSAALSMATERNALEAPSVGRSFLVPSEPAASWVLGGTALPAQNPACDADTLPCYGDIDRDGDLDVWDVEAIVALNADQCDFWCRGTVTGEPTVGLPEWLALAANVSPANLPGLGGPSDSVPPGWDSICSRGIGIGVFDVLAVAQDNVNNPDHPIAGDTIPRGTVTIAPGGAHPECIVVHAADETDYLHEGTTVRRDRCLTVGLARDASYECGDLRLAYEFPAVRTMNRDRTLVWTYNSGHARPHPVVKTWYRTPYTGPSPYRVAGTLSIRTDTAAGSWTVVASDTADADAWTRGQAGLLALGFDVIGTLGDTANWTGIYPYRMIWEHVGSDTVELEGELVIVDRSDSPYHPGGWLAGVEQLVELDDGRILWVGGDGSTSVYGGGSGSSGPLVDGLDSLLATSSGWERPLYPGGGWIRFDSLGRHVETEDRVGNVTTFRYVGSSLAIDTIVLPDYGAAASERPDVTLEYNELPGDVESFVVRIQPAVYQANPADRDFFVVERDDDVITVDPLGRQYYLDGQNRIDLSRDANGVFQRFAYSNGRLTRSARAVQPDSIIHEFRPDVEMALDWKASGPAPVGGGGGAATLWDGPRADVADTTLFWTNRYGGPDRIVNALGDTTRLDSPKNGPAARWPGLVARVEEPNGRVIRAAYDPVHANLLAVTDSGRCVGGACAVTRYSWSSRNGGFQVLDTVTQPDGHYKAYTYDAFNGNVLTQRDNRGAPSQVSFSYTAGGELMDSVDGPLTPPTVFEYSNYGNLERITSPAGYVTTILHDARGRDTLVVSPLDGVRTRRDSRQHDTFNNPLRTWSFGPRMPQPGVGDSIPADTLRVDYAYDDEQNLIRVERRPYPLSKRDTMVAHTVDDVVTTTFAYDGANRLVKKVDAGVVDSTAYDPAGNPVRVVKGATIVLEYDALNRLTKRTVPGRSFVADSVQVGDIKVLMPYLTTGGTLNIQERVDSFTYDAVGNLLRADNPFARITRGYSLDGLITVDSVALRDTTAAVFNRHFVIKHEHDRSGRRTRVVLGPDTTRYGYTSWGPVDTVWAPDGGLHIHAYDAEGRLAARRFPGSGVDTVTLFDAEGRVTNRSVDTPPIAPYLESLSYDQRHKVLTASPLGSTYAYSGLGHLAYSSETLFGGLNRSWYVTDGQGTVLVTEQVADLEDPIRLVNRISNGRIDQTEEVWNQDDPEPIDGEDYGRSTSYQYDSTRGYRTGSFSRSFVRNWNDTTRIMSKTGQRDVVHRSYYSTDDKLRFHQVSRVDSLPGAPAANNKNFGAFEEYRYDALGRRVLVRSFQDQDVCEILSRCESSWNYVVWDGSRILHETRGGTYVHGRELDAPLAVEVAPEWVSLHYDWRGLPAFSLDDTGSHTTCALLPIPGCDDIRWPAGSWTATLSEGVNPPSLNAPDFYGTLTVAQRDATDQLYRRSRYYDPSSGQFTQIDPISIAGGLNVYGYADGDPVSYSDPFGLCPDPGDIACQLFESGFMALGASIGFIGGGGAGALQIAGSGGLLTPAAVATTAAGTAAGAAAGASLGRALSNIFFSKGDDGVRRKPGSQGEFKGRDALRRENKMVRDVVKELGLDRDQQTRLHREISGQGLDYHDILETARGLFGGDG